MKKTLSLLLALALTLSAFAGFSFAEEAEASLPAEGETVSGFEVKCVRDFDLINAKLVYFVHVKTGAELIYLANDDTNRVFDITFKTPAESNMGVPHVFEHATLGGSEKYPSRDLFFNLSYQTYNTYMNAATYSHMTTYPVASLSEEQLYKYADFYTDSCFHPMVHNDESIFREEAWRYSMDSADSELTISGTVYSEMQGSYTIDSAAYHNFLSTLFPGSHAANSSGGIPSEIPNMTWQDVTSYHTAYYHPSNSLAFLYGKFDNYERFLALLDSCYSAYDKAEIVIADTAYAPIEDACEAVFAYPVEASSNTDKGGRAYYGFRMDTDDFEAVNELYLLAFLLGDDSSALIQNLKEALPAASCGCSVALETPSPAILFYADGINADEAALFKSVVDESLLEIRENGFDKNAVDAFIASFRLETLLMPESTSLGMDIIPSIAYYWASFGAWDAYLDYIDALNRFNEIFESGVLSEHLNKYFIENSLTALAVTLPAAGLKEENDAALKAALAELKASMSEEEIAQIVENTQSLAVQKESDAAQYVSELTVVTVDSLPEEIRVYDYTDEINENGVREINVNANVSGVGQAMVLLNLSDLPQDYLHWFQLYVDLLTEVDTSAHTRQELASLSQRYLYNGVIKASFPYDDKSDLYLRSAWIAADEDLEAAYDLVYEILFESQFTDAKRVQDVVSSRKNALKTSITNNIYSSQLNRAMSVSNDKTRVYVYMTDIDYYLFLDTVDQLMAEYPEAVLETLASVQAFVNNSAGAITAFAGNEESQLVNKACADSFLSKLNTREIIPAVYDIPAPAAAEGIVVDSSVQYNLLYATWEELGLEDYSGDLDAVTSLVTDAYLYPMLREQYGAYAALHGAATDGIYVISYRDPNVQETFEVYASLPEFVRSLDIDQETLDGYILSSYSYYAQASGELAGASNAIFDVIAGKDMTRSLQYMKDLKSIKAETLASYAEVYENLIANGVLSTAGGAGAIEANSALYESVINPFGAVDSSKVVLTDCPEDYPLYDYVRFAFENSLMVPSSGDTFGVDDPATLGDFCGACYAMLGGGLDPETGIAYLSYYGIVPEAPADTVLTRADAVECAAYFLSALGYELADAELGEYEDAEGLSEEMQYLFAWAMDNGLIAPATETTLAPDASMTRAEMAVLLTVLYMM